MSQADEVRGILGSQTDDKSVVAQALLKVIMNAQPPERREDLLAIALVERENVAQVQKSLQNFGIPDDTWDQLSKSHSDLIKGHLKMAFFKSRTAEDFASGILRMLDFLSTDEEKTYALARALYSQYVPYRQLPGTPLHMSNREFKEKILGERERLGLIEYIITLPFDEYTECASMLLQVLDDTSDKEARVALLAAAWRRIEDKIVKSTKESK